MKLILFHTFEFDTHLFAGYGTLAVRSLLKKKSEAAESPQLIEFEVCRSVNVPSSDVRDIKYVKIEWLGDSKQIGIHRVLISPNIWISLILLGIHRICIFISEYANFELQEFDMKSISRSELNVRQFSFTTINRDAECVFYVHDEKTVQYSLLIDYRRDRFKATYLTGMGPPRQRVFEFKSTSESG